MTWKGTRTRRLPASWASPRAARSLSCSRHARSYAGYSRIWPKDSPLALVKSMALPSKELSEQALDALITREQTRVVAPLTEWRSLSMSLRQEGLIHDASTARQSAQREYVAEPVVPGSGWFRTTARWTMRLAASAALVGVGIVAGRGMTVRIGGKEFSSKADARRTLLRAQTDYQRAAAFLAATDTGPRITAEPDLYRDRLAGLDEMTAASLAAIKDAPRDPLLNQYYLSASAAREATLQQLGNALPVGSTMTSF